MFDAQLRKIIDPPLNRIAPVIVGLGVRGDTLTLFGLIFASFGFAALSFQQYTWALSFIILSRLMDGLDGPVARHGVSTDFGGYFDIFSDFIFYAGTVFFFAVGRPEVALAAAFLLFGFFGSGASFLAYAIIATKRGSNHEEQGKKSFFYLAGITEGGETIALFVLFCLFPGSFSVFAYLYGFLCLITAVGRTQLAYRDFSS